MNAKQELIEHIGNREVELVRILFGQCYWSGNMLSIEGGLEDVLPKLDFEYDDGYGGQELFGYIWYKDGTWSEREEYNGSECWKHKSRPPIDIKIEFY
jgi:hypothetical protein